MGSWWANRWYVQNFEKPIVGSYSGFKSKILICDFSRSVTWTKPFTNWFANVQNSSTRWYPSPLWNSELGWQVALKSKIWFAIFAILAWCDLGKSYWRLNDLNQSWAIPCMFEILKIVFLRALGSLSPKILFAISDFLWVGQNFLWLDCLGSSSAKLWCVRNFEIALWGSFRSVKSEIWFAIYDLFDLGKTFYKLIQNGQNSSTRWFVQTLKFASGGASHFKVENLICDFRYFRRCVAWANLFYDSMYLVSSWANRWHVRKLEIALWECSRTFTSEILIAIAAYLTWAKLLKVGQTWAKLGQNFGVCHFTFRQSGVLVTLSPKFDFKISRRCVDLGKTFYWLGKLGQNLGKTLAYVIWIFDKVGVPTSRT